MNLHNIPLLPSMLKRTAWRAMLCTALVALLAHSNAAIAADAANSASQVQFGGQCTEALAEGHHVMTDCKITWTDKDGKVYCFNNEGSKKAFLENPNDNLQRARDFMAASSVESTEKEMQNFTGSDAETLVKELIGNKTKANNGVFPFNDPLHGDHLKLSYDDIDFTRTIDGYGFFPDVKFHDSADAQKRYLVDFWVLPVNGQLQVQETRIYKSPQNVDGKWTLMTRQPVPWWWIPASEHPGHLATKRGWEVMSAVEQNATMQSAKNNGVFKLKDDKTGKELELEFIDTHQPVRQLDVRHLLRLYRLPGGRHQGSDLRHRFLGVRQGRKDVRESDQGAQGSGVQGGSVGAGAAIRMEGPGQFPRRALRTARSLLRRHRCHR